MYGSSKSHKLKTTEVKPWSFSRPKAQKASSRLNVFCEIAQHRMFAFFFFVFEISECVPHEIRSSHAILFTYFRSLVAYLVRWEFSSVMSKTYKVRDKK